MATIGIKRTYEPVSPSDGWRVLVERLWPRGMRKEDLQLSAWEKDVAPSPALRKWYSHDVSRWPEFQRRYRQELDQNPEAWRPILDVARSRQVTLLFSARDVEHNSAVVLRDYLMAHADNPGTKENDTARQVHLDALLDEALRETFPASDPVAVSCDRGG
jgi:uncharacterized protein YeaO (DUF488 family)